MPSSNFCEKPYLPIMNEYFHAACVVCRSSTPMKNLKINKYGFKGWVVCDVFHFSQGLWQRYWDDWEAALSSHCECSHQDKVRRDGKWFPCYSACLASDSSMQYLLFLWLFLPFPPLFPSSLPQQPFLTVLLPQKMRTIFPLLKWFADLQKRYRTWGIFCVIYLTYFLRDLLDSYNNIIAV